MVVAGQSSGELMAAFAAFRIPERSGNVLSQSGDCRWDEHSEFDGDSEWLTRQFARAPHLPLRCYLEGGLQAWICWRPIVTCAISQR